MRGEESDSRKKILFIIPSLVAGGAERSLLNLLLTLNQKKYKISIILLEDLPKVNPLEGLGNHGIVCLKKKNRWDLGRLVFCCGDNIRRINPDVIVCVMTYSTIITFFSLFFFSLNKKVISWEHSVPVHDLRTERFSGLKALLIKLFYRRAEKIITVSKEAAKEYIEYFYLKPENVMTIYNPIPLEVIKKKSLEAVDHPFINGEDYLIITAGRLEHVKRYDRLLRIFALLRGQSIKAKLVIAGKGTLERDLRKLSKELGIQDYVSFIGFRDDIFSWIKKADLFVLTSDYEGFPMVLLESMACGTPVITSYFAGVTELVENGKNGVIVNSNDEKDFAQAIIKLLKDEELCETIKEHGLSCVKKFGTEKLVSDFEFVFDRA